MQYRVVVECLGQCLAQSQHYVNVINDVDDDYDGNVQDFIADKSVGRIECATIFTHIHTVLHFRKRY